MSRSCPLTSSFRTCLKEAIADEETEPADILEDLALIEEEAMPVDSYLSMSIAAIQNCANCPSCPSESKASKKSKKGKSKKRALQTEEERARDLIEPLSPRGRARRLPWGDDCDGCCDPDR